MGEVNTVGRSTLDPGKRVDILLVEYMELRKEVRLYASTQRRYLNTYGAIVLSGFVAAFYYKILIAFIAIPILSLALIALFLTDFYLVVALGVRIRHIEDEISFINGEVPLIKWDNTYVPRLLTLSPVVILRIPPDKTIRFPNLFWPIHISIFAVVVLVSGISMWQVQYVIFNTLVLWSYVILLILTHVAMIVYFAFALKAVHGLSEIKNIEQVGPEE